jgi:decaprenylphospho-beta-D-ribofuranose 2-oxidase
VTVSTRRVLSGWGRATSSAADVVTAADAGAVWGALAEATAGGRPLVARGLGRSYGDAAQCAGGLVVDMTAHDEVIDLDLRTDAGGGWIRVGAGASLDALMRRLVPEGWFLPVTPGTRFVTVGGAIAADVHGKNHHRDGSFCSHVLSMTLATPTGVRIVAPDRDPALFWATAGGMGLTGAILDATLALLPVETSAVIVDTERADDLDDLMARMVAHDHEYRYSVAWVDCLGGTRGRSSAGRAVLTRGHHARARDLTPSERARWTLAFDPAERVRVPVTAPGGLLGPAVVAAFNEAWFRRAARQGTGRLEALSAFFHPLDGVAGWNRLYGPRGFLQYQFVVPWAAADTVRHVVRRLSDSRTPSFLAVLKRFGPGDPGPLSFPLEGWTLALDLPLGAAGLGALLDELDEEVADAGGRVYLAKDARLRPEMLASMYPRLDEWRQVQVEVDPDGVMASDLARRTGLLRALVGSR